MIVLGNDLEVIVERKRIKNIYFRINEDKQIYVTCPKYVSTIEIDHLLKENIKSLERMYKKVVKHDSEKEHILFLGKELDFVQYKKIMFDENTAFGPSVDEVNAYLEKHSLKFFQERMDIYLPSYGNIPKFRLRIRKMKSRWGVCNKSSMTVTLNTLLIHKKPYLIDYVICHELAHFYHMDHSQDFWKCVEEHFPRYKEARKELRD